MKRIRHILKREACNYVAGFSFSDSWHLLLLYYFLDKYAVVGCYA